MATNMVVKMRGAGDRLREVRRRRGLSTRQVAELSRAVAAQQASEQCIISRARLAQIENEGSVPSIFKLFSLSAIYGVPLNELLSAYVELPALGEIHHSMNAAHTHALLPGECEKSKAAIPFPVRFDSSARAEETNLLSRMVEAWGEVPLSLLSGLNVRKYRYAWIGLSDYTMYPLIRPGSFVQIDECQKIASPSQYRTEYDRPIYFVELRTGYICSWCEVSKGRLLSIPHPLSPCRARQFAVPSEAEIIGRVTGVAVRLVAAGVVREKGEEYYGCPGGVRPERPLAVAGSRVAEPGL